MVMILNRLCNLAGKIPNRLRYLIGMVPVQISLRLLPEAIPAVRQLSINRCPLLVLANETVGRQLVMRRGYEREETAFLRDLIQPRDVCLDIGANVGYYTVLLASLAQSGHVHSFEPAPLPYHLLCSSVLLNRFAHVTVTNCAVSDVAGEGTLHIAPDSAFSTLEPSALLPGPTSTRVSITTVDQYVAQQGIEEVNFMKIDVEGAELDVLRGATALLSSRTGKPGVIMLELSASNAAQFSHTPDQVVNLLAGHGYAALVLRKGVLVPFHPSHLAHTYNVFFRAT